MPKDEIEEFITLDDDEKSQEEKLESPILHQELEETKNFKLIYLMLALMTALAFGTIALVTYLYLDKKESKKRSNDINQSASKIIKEIKTKEQEALIKQNNSYQVKLNLAKKLYREGNVTGALAIQNELSTYTKDLAFYNLAVADMKKGGYLQALKEFEKAKENPKLAFESTLNIAITYLKMGDESAFKRYLKEAKKLLLTQRDSSLFAYYKALIDYYSGHFPEALVPLNHPSSNFYSNTKALLAAKIYTSVNNQMKAAKILETQIDDLFALALLYASEGEYELSKKSFEKLLKDDIKNTKAKVALSLVYNKLGLLKKASDMMKNSHSEAPDKAARFYPISVALKESLFDPVSAQKEFKKNIFFNERNRLLYLFYFAPFELASPKLSIQNIKKGANFVYINRFDLGESSLNEGKMLSETNLMINSAIKKAIMHDLYSAKDILLKALKKSPNSSILHYNLALIYAKLSIFNKAYKHFKTSSILDVNNHLASIFMHYCNKLLYKKVDQSSLDAIMKKLSLSNATEKEKRRAKLLIAILENQISSIDFDDLNSNIFDISLLLLNAHILGDRALYQREAKLLQKSLPDDIVSNILYIDAIHDSDDIKAYAKAVQERFIAHKIDYSSIDRGYTFARELYINMLNIAGVVHRFREREKRLIESGQKSVANLQALALADIYLQKFEEAFKIYNELIDNYAIKDSNTLFLAAVSAIGANHHANAIALLELAKLTNKSNFESRYALGLLYQEVKNLEGAAIEFSIIGDIGFKSRYFTFALK